jgi:hypothetical protein
MLALARKKNYSMIGRMLYKTHPEVASSIEKVLTPGEETDLTRIFSYYARFTSLDLPDPNPVSRRRVFIAVMLRMYHPSCLHTGIIKVKNGFVKNIGACFGCVGQAITRNIREVIIMNKAYDEFQATVNDVFEKLKNE